MLNLPVLFKKIQKDDKKEVLHFQVNGDFSQYAAQVIELAGEIVVFKIGEGNEYTAEFHTLQVDSKKSILKFNVKGDASALYAAAGTNVTLSLNPAQMTVEEFYGEDPRDEDESDEEDENQAQIDFEGSEPAAASETGNTPTSEGSGTDRKPRGGGRSRKKVEQAPAAQASSDPADDLPF